MKLIAILLTLGMLASSGWAEDAKPEPYSPELVKSAETGDANAQCALGSFHYFGDGVTTDYKEAVKWLTKSAEQGNAVAQANLGACYYRAKGVAQDYNEAVKWWTKSAEQGNAGAQANLAVCYSKGKGVTQE